MTPGCYVGIDLGGSSAKGIAMWGEKSSQVSRIATGAGRDSDSVMDDLASLARSLAGDSEILALGLGVPGLIDSARGTVVFWGTLGWDNVALVSELSARLSVPVVIDNDGRVAALGELWHGSAKGHDNFIYLTLGTGIGSGIYVEGKVLRGSSWAAGEVGHTVLLPEGPLCSCGNRGCLEALASASAIARDARIAATKHPDSLLMRLTNGDTTRITAALVAEADCQGDPVAKAVLDAALGWLGIGVANLVNVFNPELVVLGGGASLMGERMLAAVRNSVEKMGMPVQRQSVKLTLSSLGDLAGMYGALELASGNAGKLFS